MKEKERDTFDDLFRSKLENFEADVQPDDWEAIASRLPGPSPLALRRRLRYWAAAAVFSLLVVTGALYLSRQKPVGDPVALEIKAATDTLETRLAATAESIAGEKNKEQNALGESQASTAAPMPAPVASVLPAPAGRHTRQAVTKNRPVDPATLFAADTPGDADRAETPEPPVAQALAEADPENEQSRTEIPPIPQITSANNSEGQPATKTAASPSRKQKKAPARKWGIGMGAGGLSVGSDNVVPQYVTNSSSLRSESLMLMNAVYFNDMNLPKTEIHHKTPVSFGLSVSRFLNNRFSLQAGVNYAFLSSEWETNGGYRAKTKQKLHFIGIPLSVSYKIAEWNRFNVYAAAGGMAEVNVAGKRQTQFIYREKEMDREREHVRMKEWLWSVNARAGVSYPLIRFVSAFAEVGASYYFDNGSAIETVHSEKPFNVSLQLGFRLGF